MAFATIEKTARGREKSTACAVALTKYKTQSAAICINEVTAARLGWKHKDKAIIQIGSGDDDGWIAVQSLPSGGNGASAFSFGREGATNNLRISASKLLPHISHSPKIECKFQIVAGVLFIKIPERLRQPSRASEPTIPDMANRAAAE